MSVVTQDLVKDTALRDQIKVWSSEQKLQLPEPVPLLTNTAGAAGLNPQQVSPPLTSCGRSGGGVASSEPLAASETKEAGEVEKTITEPGTGDEEAGSEVKENIPENFIQTITEVKEVLTEDHLIETSTDSALTSCSPNLLFT